MQKPIKNLSFLVLLTLSAVFGNLAHAGAAQKTIFYSVTSNDVWTAGMALGQADMAMKSGYKVVVFLNVRGIYIASTKRAQDTFGATGKTLQAMLQDLIAADARVIICPMCMKQAGMKMDEVITGIEKGGPSTFEIMTASDTTVISF